MTRVINDVILEFRFFLVAFDCASSIHCQLNKKSSGNECECEIKMKLFMIHDANIRVRYRSLSLEQKRLFVVWVKVKFECEVFIYGSCAGQ